MSGQASSRTEKTETLKEISVYINFQPSILRISVQHMRHKDYNPYTLLRKLFVHICIVYSCERKSLFASLFIKFHVYLSLDNSDLWIRAFLMNKYISRNTFC